MSQNHHDVAGDRQGQQDAASHVRIPGGSRERRPCADRINQIDGAEQANAVATSHRYSKNEKSRILGCKIQLAQLRRCLVRKSEAGAGVDL